MTGTTFKAVVVEEEHLDGGKRTVTAFRTLSIDDLPERDVLVKVEYSSLNYKDALAVLGNRNKVVRSLPMIPGIDLAGIVVSSKDKRWVAGDRVMVNGFGLSEQFWGGFSQYQRVDAAWLLRVPEALSNYQAMAIGTAGYTAALSIDAIEELRGSGENRDALVTGAAGGVGSYAVALLAARGYKVHAVTGRPSTHEYLTGLGAHTIIPRAELAEEGRPLQSEKWDVAIDTVGGQTLANVLAQTRYRGVVTACGLAGGITLPATVLPFILRGVALVGIDSVEAGLDRREKAWTRLNRDLDTGIFENIAESSPLSEIESAAERLLNGEVRGRIVVDVNS